MDPSRTVGGGAVGGGVVGGGVVGGGAVGGGAHQESRGVPNLNVCLF